MKEESSCCLQEQTWRRCINIVKAVNRGWSHVRWTRVLYLFRSCWSDDGWGLFVFETAEVTDVEIGARCIRFSQRLSTWYNCINKYSNTALVQRTSSFTLLYFGEWNVIAFREFD